MCDCIKLEFRAIEEVPLPIATYYLTSSGTYNESLYFQFNYQEVNYFIWFDDGAWIISTTLGSGTFIANVKNDSCPISTEWEIESGQYYEVNTYESNECFTYIEDRQKFEFKSIKLPGICGNEDRGLNDCCCEELVLAKTTSNSWQTDKTSAWIKLSAPGDTVNFVLYKNGVSTNYIPIATSFVNEPNAFYTTINWNQVLLSDGIGCYELKIQYNISGVSAQFTWGKYKLLPFTIKNALNTARIRAFFNAYHEIEQIDFTGSNVESTFRFNGYIGNRQPNTEIDNIIYGNREMKRVIRENLNEYEILVDPSLKCITRPLIDLYFLSENELFISDYNAHNHDYCLNDLPVIVSESPEMTYYDFSRKASIKCIVSDKFKNKRTYY